MKISIRRGKQGGQYNCVLRVLGQWVMRTSTKMLHITRFVERLGGTLTLIQYHKMFFFPYFEGHEVIMVIIITIVALSHHQKI